MTEDTGYGSEEIKGQTFYESITLPANEINSSHSIVHSQPPYFLSEVKYNDLMSRSTFWDSIGSLLLALSAAFGVTPVQEITRSYLSNTPIVPSGLELLASVSFFALGLISFAVSNWLSSRRRNAKKEIGNFFKDNPAIPELRTRAPND